MDAALAIDRFLNGLESGWSEVSKKKKTTPSSNASHVPSGSSSRSGTGGTTTSQAHHGGGRSGRQGDREKDRDRSDRDRGDRDRGERERTERERGERERDRSDRDRDRERHKGSISSGQGSQGHSHGRQNANGHHSRGRHPGGGAGHDAKLSANGGAAQPAASSPSHTLGYSATSSSIADTWGTDALANAATASAGQSAADAWGTSAANGQSVVDSWGASAGNGPSVADSWGDTAPSVPVATSSESAVDLPGAPSLAPSAGKGTTFTIPGTQPDPVGRNAATETRRTINYAAAAATGTSHAKPAPPRLASGPVASASASADVQNADSAPSVVQLNGPIPSSKTESRLPAQSLSAGDAADAKKRRNRGGRKHRARLEAIRGGSDGGNVNPGSTGPQPVDLLSTSATMPTIVTESTPDFTAKELEITKPLSDPVSGPTLESTGNRPNAWTARVAAKETSSDDIATTVPPVSLSVSSDAKTDALSLQFGSFGLGGVDWSTSEQQPASKSIVNVAPVVAVSESTSAPVTGSSVTVPGVSSTAGMSLPISAAGISGADVGIPVSSIPSAHSGASLIGLGGAPPAMPPLGGGGGFAPSSYGAPNPYGMMPLGYNPTGLSGYEGTGDLKGLPPQPMPFFDPSSIPTGLPGAPGKFGGPAIPDMNLLPSGPPGSATSKIPGMDLDKNAAPGPGSQGAIPDMYMMGYAPQNVGYPPLYGFAPNPYTGGLPPGSVPPPGSNPYGYSAYPTQNAPLGGGKFGSNNQSQGGRGGFGFDESGGMMAAGVGRNAPGLNDSIYAHVPAYLGAQIPDSMMGSNNSTGGMQKPSNPDTGYKSGRGSSNVNATSHLGSQSGNQSSGHVPHNVAGGIPNMYGNDYSVMNTGPTGSGAGWIDVNRGTGIPRDGNPPPSLPQGSSGMYTAAPPTGYWPPGGYY